VASPAAPVRTPTSDEPLRRGSALTIQVAALTDGASARALVATLRTAGYSAYLVEPIGGDGLYRVRVGHFTSRATASHVVTRLERRMGEKLWVTRER
jgi:cell division septation protein DedD